MAVEVMTWVFKHSRSRNAERLVMLAIADACNSKDGTGAWLSNAALVSKTALSERAVREAVKTCETKLGELSVARGKGPGGVSRFHVLMSVDGKGAGSAPLEVDRQDLPPAGSAPIRSDEAVLVDVPRPAKSAPKARRARPAGSAPGTVRTKNSSTKSSSDVDPTTQTILAAWIDYLGKQDVKLPKQIIGRYANVIKTALDENFKPDLIKKALATLARDNNASRPSLLAERLVSVQTGPQRWEPKAPAAVNEPYSQPQYAPRDEKRCEDHPTELAGYCTVCDSERRAVRTPAA